VCVKYAGDDQYVRPEHRAVVYRTDDGGETWYERYNPDLEISLTCVDFLDANHGWVAGFPTRSSVTGGAVFSTSDGGETWEHHEPGGSIYAPLWDIEFLDQDRGYVVGANYVAAWGPPVWRTLDGGETWEEIAMDQHENDGLFDLAVMEDRVVALGDHDYVITSTDPWGTYEWPHGENLFTQAFINIHYRFEDVFFLDEDTGWAVGSRSFIPEHTGQVILHTADGGLTWKTQYEQAPLFDLFSVFRLDSVYFVDDETGWAVGRSEYDESNDPHWAILYTSDGGLHWEEQGQELCEDVSPEFFAVQFLDGLHGWALDKGHYDRDNDMHALFLAHTTDGGATWEWVSTEITGSMSVGFALVQGDVAFTDEQHGWAVGGLGKVIYTGDGGVHWERQDFAEDWRRLFAIEMLDNQEGWIGGEGLFHTRDGGAHWTMEDVDIGGDVQDVQFVDALNGWLAGARGRILVTRDGGDTWHEVDNNVSSFTLLGLSFVDQDKGWLVGDYGTILTTIQIPYWPVYLPLVTRG
jgi:photosystem II stability/assembly factor-like uncharacterized protein